ncbi:nucleotidyltransferase domain-containing protein [Vineibacter terrae]|uniref:Nucleotidyltransferase domain-containing protein n=1 Tax=Vineibacter terrae TaxID=2586908 RepID=A0A5C8PM58_9HYPH|nr:nucleotidyltransferase domain-containing protein [Vineibacter terrae]TXL74838.1 nucleotidyltransferase domain-containing protein [Vineibacter terrae]
MPIDPDVIPPRILARIAAALEDIETTHAVAILFAVESGSRAWGFHSPDSDFDVRFVYAHRRDWYLSVQPARDVIEQPIIEGLDVSGWDIRKALALACRFNPVLPEWLRSPVVYRWAVDLVGPLQHFVGLRPGPVAARRHYLGLARRQFLGDIDGRDSVRLKKYFYSIRPAVALRWLHQQPDDALPMDLPGLRAGARLDPEVSQAIDHLLALKAQAHELGTGPRVPCLDDFIRAEIDAAERWLATQPAADRPDLAAADAALRAIVGNAEAMIAGRGA